MNILPVFSLYHKSRKVGEKWNPPFPLFFLVFRCRGEGARATTAPLLHFQTPFFYLVMNQVLSLLPSSSVTQALLKLLHSRGMSGAGWGAGPLSTVLITLRSPVCFGVHRLCQGPFQRAVRSAWGAQGWIAFPVTCHPSPIRALQVLCCADSRLLPTARFCCCFPPPHSYISCLVELQLQCRWRLQVKLRKQRLLSAWWCMQTKKIKCPTL